MTGYLKPNFKNIPSEYKKEYKSFYCGLCKSIKMRYGYIGILNLNYEITAFLILLYGLKNERLRVFRGSCTISPFVPVRYIDYYDERIICAAHLSILIAYYEVKDNQKDTGGTKWNVAERFLKTKFDNSKQSLNNRFSEICTAISSFYKIESDKSASFESLLESDGDLVKAFLSALVYDFDMETTSYLLELTSLLGKWIYLMDACDDYEEDIENCVFNPLSIVKDKTVVFNTVESIENRIEEIIKKLQITNYSELIDFLFIKNLKEKSKTIIDKLYI